MSGIAGRIAGAFIDSKLTPLFIGASLLAGLFSIVSLPREEEPQIIVPMIDVFVAMPGAGVAEVEERVTRPMEKLLWEIPGVEYIYSTSSAGGAMAIVRFKVGEDEEKSIVKLNQKLFANFDIIPPGASAPLVKPRSIDDVPILALTFHSRRFNDLELRRVAAQVTDVVKQAPAVSGVTLIGGQRRTLRVTVDPARLAAYNLTPIDIWQRLGAANVRLDAGRFTQGDLRARCGAGGRHGRRTGAVRAVWRGGRVFAGGNADGGQAERRERNRRCRWGDGARERATGRGDSFRSCGERDAELWRDGGGEVE